MLPALTFSGDLSGGGISSLEAKLVAIQGTAITGKTGTGDIVFNDSPVFITPTLGAALATSINFGAQSLSTYADGAWPSPPELAFGGASTGITYTYHAGTFVKIGKFVLVTVAIGLSSKGSATGAAQIKNLPYTSETGAAQYAFGAPVFSTLVLVNKTPYATSYGTGSAATLDLATLDVNGAPALLTDADFTNATSLFFSLAYIATTE